MGDLGVGVCNLACTSSHLGVPDENLSRCPIISRYLGDARGKSDLLVLC